MLRIRAGRMHLTCGALTPLQQRFFGLRVSGNTFMGHKITQSSECLEERKVDGGILFKKFDIFVNSVIVSKKDASEG